MSRRRGLFASHVRMLRAIIITAVLLACGDSSNPVGPGGGGGGQVAQISISPSVPTVTLGAQLALQADVRDANGGVISGASVFWSSADTTIVSISSTGVVTGKAVGSAQVAASSGGQSARVVVSVVSIPVASITVAPAAATIVVGGTTRLQAVTSAADGSVLTGRTVVWASSAPQVAAVDGTGTIIGASAGTATITATAEGKTAPSTITVTIIPIAAIAIAPGSAALLVGQSASLTAIATDANGNVLGGRPMTWKSADTTIASVSALGLVTAVGPGTTSVGATAEGKTGAAQVVVTSPTPTPVASVSVNPTTAALVIGSTLTISATVRDANGGTLSGRVVTWTSSDAAVATVSNSGVVTAVATGNATITATSEGKNATAAVTVSAIPVASVTVAPPSASLLVGGTTTLTTVTKDADGNVLSGRVVTWTSSAPSIATVSSSGVVTGVGAGDATITATSEGRSGTASISVALAPVATITLTPSSASLVVGSGTTLAAVLKDANGNVLTGRSIAWSSSMPGVATVDGNGAVTAVAAGTATITSTSEGKRASATITVSLVPVAFVVAAPTSVALFVDSTALISATAQDANHNPLPGRVVTWTSSAPAIATVNSATGLVTGVAPGNATITATSETKTAVASVVVSLVPVASVSISPSSLTMITDSTITLSATTRDNNNQILTGRAVSWTSDNTAVASIGLTTGTLTTDTTGSAHITATSEGKSATATVTVNPAPVGSVTLNVTTVGLQVPATTSIIATTRDVHGNLVTGRTVSWASSDATTATVSTAGLVSAVAQGTATITATSEGRTSAPATVTVTDPVASVTVTPSAPTVAVYQTTPLAATTKDGGGTIVTGRGIAWGSASPSIATVDANGVVTGVAAGTAVVTATSEGQSGNVTVTVTAAPVASVIVAPSAASVQMGGTVTFTDTTKDSHLVVLTGRTVTWASSNTGVATIDAGGTITPVAAGTTNITATSETITSAPAVLTITPIPVATVVVAPSSASLTVNQTRTFAATPEDANNQPLSGRTVTWSSDNTAIATVDPSTGLVTAVAAGTANIIATSETKTGSAVVTVTDPVTSVTVSPTAPSITVGQTQQMTATTTDINGQPLSGRTVTWASDNSAVASVDPSTGIVTAVAAGTANVTASSEGVTSSPAVVTVTNVPVATVDVTPANPSISAGTSETVALTATPRDGGGTALSMSGRTLTWASDTPAVATVDPSTGVVTAVAQGSATITATVDGVPGSTVVTVNP